MAEDKTRPDIGPESQDAPKSRGGSEKKEDTMATTNNDPLLRDRRKMYESFLSFATYGSAFVAIVLVLLAIFLL